MSVDFFSDIEEIELAVDDAKQSEKVTKPVLPKHTEGERFLKGPIPWKWLTLAGQQSGKALHIGLHLWYLAGMNYDEGMVSINLSRMVNDWGMERTTASRGLKALEDAGLISVVRLPGRKPRVTILAA